MAYNYIQKKATYVTELVDSIDYYSAGTPYRPAECYWISVFNADWFNGYDVVVNADGSVSLVPNDTPNEPTDFYYCVPAQPATPPQYLYTKNVYTSTKTFNLGWNSGGESIASFGLYTAFSFEPTVDSVGIVIGAADQASIPGYGYSLIEFAFLFDHGTFSVMEKGVEKTGRANFTQGDRFAIHILDGVVNYFRNNSLVYTTNSYPTSLPLRGDISMYSAGDRVDNAKISTIVVAPFIESKTTTTSYAGAQQSAIITSALATSADAFGGIVGEAIQGVAVSKTSTSQTSAYTFTVPGGNATSKSTLSTVQAFGQSYYAKSDTAFALMTGNGLSGITSYGSSVASFKAMTTEVEAAYYVPVVQTGAGEFAFMVTAGHCFTGQVSTSSNMTMEPFDGLAANKAYGESNVSFQPMKVRSQYTFEYDGMVAATPEMTLSAAGYPTATHRANLTAPTMTLVASGGGSAELTAPMPTLAISGTLESVGKFERPAPRPYLDATMLAGAIGSASNLKAPTMSLAAQGGSGLVATTPFVTASVIGVMGIVGNVEVDAPVITLTASGTRENYGTAEVTAPTPRMVYAVAEMLAPMPTLSIAESVVTSTINHVYAVNKTLGELTEYTNYAAEFTGTLNGLPLMIDNAGINLITGDNDNGAVIDSSATFAVSDFGASEQKRLMGVYLTGKGDNELYVVVRSADDQESVNDTDNRYHVGADTRRLKVGKGLHSRYLGISVESSAGTPFSIAGVEYLIGVMERRR